MTTTRPSVALLLLAALAPTVIALGDLPCRTARAHTSVVMTRRRMSALAAASALLGTTLPASAAVGPTKLSMERLRTAAQSVNDGDLNEALRVTEQVIELQPSYSGGWASRASIAVQRRDYAAALRDYDKAFEVGPLDADEAALRLNRGCVLTAAGRPVDAVADFNRALELDSKNRLVVINRALAYMDLGEEEKAYSDLKGILAAQALEAQPFWLIQGLLLADRGDYQQATGILKRVENKFDAADDVHAALAYTLTKQGKEQEAQQQWAKVKFPKNFADTSSLVRKPRRWPRAVADDMVKAVVPQLS